MLNSDKQPSKNKFRNIIVAIDEMVCFVGRAIISILEQGKSAL